MPGFWRKCRIAFRCVRFTLWGVVLLLLVAFGWFNLVGLPDFLKTRLVTALHEQGVQLEFTRMRLRIIHGLVCDSVHIGSADNTPGPQLTAREVQIRINLLALLRRNLEVSALILRQGKLELPLDASDTLTFTNLQGELRILPDDTWSLDQFRTGVMGVNLNFAGTIAHAREFRQWTVFAPTPARGQGRVQTSLQGLADTLRQMRFSGKTQLNARLDGDARDMNSFTFSMSARVAGFESPWLSISNLDFAAHLRALTNAPVYSGPIQGAWTNLQPFRLDWMARGNNLKCSKVKASAIDCTGFWGDPKDTNTFSVTVSARARGVETPWGSMYDVDFATRAATPAGRGASVDPGWGFWTNLQPFQADWLLRGSGVELEQLGLNSVACSGSWDAPRLIVTNLSAHFNDGSVGVDVTLDVASRILNFAVNSGIDPHLVESFLDENTRQLLAEVTWHDPPKLSVNGWLTLPSWTNRPQPWQENARTNMVVRGEIGFTNAQIAKLPLPITLKSQLSYSNRVWQIAALDVAQGRTRLKVAGEVNELDGNFHGVTDGRLASECITPFLTDPEALKGFHHLQFHEPMAFSVGAAGNLHSIASLSATGSISLAQFAIREQWIDSLATSFSYTNRMAEFYSPHLERSQGKEKFDAEKVVLDISGEKLFLINGRGNVLPMAVGRAIGPQTAEAMSPYEFLAVPHATVNGCIPLKQVNDDLVVDDADLRFDVMGTVPFQWRKFQTPAMTGTIIWKARYLILTNIVADCYGGKAGGNGVFDLKTPGDGTEFSFFIDGTNVDLNAMGVALWSPTNQLRGSLSAKVTVTRANSSDWRTWNGFGEGTLKNGLLWNAPVLGLMSPILNTLTPGFDLGNSKATEASGRFIMTDGVIFTDSLVIRSLTMRLDYVGTVDLEEKVNARVRAQLLRNTPVIGSLVSAMLTPVSIATECDVTGTLDEPKISPVFIPFSKVLTAPLHPIRTMEKIFSPTQTNSPPKQ